MPWGFRHHKIILNFIPCYSLTLLTQFFSILTVADTIISLLVPFYNNSPSKFPNNSFFTTCIFLDTVYFRNTRYKKTLINRKACICQILRIITCKCVILIFHCNMNVKFTIRVQKNPVN